MKLPSHPISGFPDLTLELSLVPLPKISEPQAFILTGEFCYRGKPEPSLRHLTLQVCKAFRFETSLTRVVTELNYEMENMLFKTVSNSSFQETMFHFYNSCIRPLPKETEPDLKNLLEEALL